MRLRKLTKCLILRLEGLKESGAISTETGARRAGQTESIRAFCPLQETERYSTERYSTGDKEMPAPRKMSSLVTYYIFQTKLCDMQSENETWLSYTECLNLR